MIPARDPGGDADADRGPPAGRRVRGRARPGRHRPVPDPAQRRRRGLRARLDAGRRPRRVAGADPAHARAPVCSGSTRSPATSWSRCAATASPRLRVLPARRRAVRHRLPRADLHASDWTPTRSTTPARSGCTTPRWSPRTASTTTTCAPGEMVLRKQQAGARRLRPGRRTSSTGSGPRPPTARWCRSRWSAGAAPPRDGTAPTVLYGYGSYEASMDPWFSIARLSLLDRGFVFAVAHVRGGGEMGRRWYERRQADGQEEHVHRLRRLRRAPGRGGLDLAASGWWPGAARPAACSWARWPTRPRTRSPASSPRCRSWTRSTRSSTRRCR